MHSMLSNLRRELHAVPELDFDLPETSAIVRRVLEPLPCRVFSPSRGAVCAFFDAGKPCAVAVRADMDALPVAEQTGAPYASRHAGRMHACGHDGHMAMALALACDVAEHLSELPRNVLFVFQPAEETTGGAKFVCESGVFEEYHADRIFGFHLWPGIPAGRIVSRPGPLLARSSETTVTVRGKSAHIARAEEGADALLAAVRFVCGASDVMNGVRREFGPCLLKFGRMESGTVRNALSARSQLLGSLRVFSDEAFEAAKARLGALARALETDSGCRFELHFSEGYPPVRNDEALFSSVRAALPEMELLDAPLMIAEDFAFYQRALPGVFLLLGTGDTPPLHADTFDFDESVLEAGFGAWRALVRMP